MYPLLYIKTRGLTPIKADDDVCEKICAVALYSMYNLVPYLVGPAFKHGTWGSCEPQVSNMHVKKQEVYKG